LDKARFERDAATTRLGSYEIVRKLARGGMAEIFLARTRGPSGFEKLVVLKKILPKYADKQRFVQLFLEEAKLAASLDHPNIVQVYDIGIADGAYFFTMEYLHGQDVRSILHRAWRTGERFAIEHAVQIARNVAAALHFAHEKPHTDGALLGIVHRDVSPSNVIVTYDGATKLLDFGVAKTTASTVKTRTGALKGKIAYMSPEQARGAPLDRRSDIFALGIMLWEMVTTQRLFKAENDFATLQLIINQAPRPPTSVRPECPPELEQIVLRALAQDPEARYQTAEQLVLELDELAREHKLKQTPNALASALGQLFAPELAAWREARSAGVALADHLNDIGEQTAPVLTSDFIELDASVEEPVDDLDDLDDEDDDDEDNEKTEHMPVLIDPPTGASEPITELAVVRAAAVTTPLAASGGSLAAQGGPGGASADDPDDLDGSMATLVSPLAVPSSPFPGADGSFASHASAMSSPFAAPPWKTGQPQPHPTGERPRSWAVIDLPAFDPGAFARQRRIVLRIAAGVVGAVFLLAILAGHC
jgi:serine/threonine protein kinase